MMVDHAIKRAKYKAHVEAIESHKLLLEKLHVDANVDVNALNWSVEQVAKTLTDYLKVLGLP